MVSAREPMHPHTLISTAMMQHCWQANARRNVDKPSEAERLMHIQAAPGSGKPMQTTARCEPMSKSIHGVHTLSLQLHKLALLPMDSTYADRQI